MSAGSASWPLIVSVALIAGGAGYLLSPRSPASLPETAASGDAPRESTKTGLASPALAQLDELSTENKNLKRQIGELVTKLEKTAEASRVHEEALKAARADLVAARQTQPAPAVEKTIEKPKSAPAPIASVKWQEALDKVDWAEAGQALKEMMPLLTEYAYSMRDEKPMPESVGRLSQWNGALVDAALKLKSAGIPGNGVNGAYTHFIAVVNQMATYLSATGLPLTQAQSKSLSTIAADYDDRDERRRAGEPGGAPVLASMLGESRLKEAFYGALRQELDPPQRQALVPEDLRDRVGADLFSTALLWATGMKPLKVAGREEFTRQMKAELVRELELGPEETGLVGAIVEDWCTGLDEAHFNKADALELKGMIRLSRIHQAASAQLGLLERLQTSGGLSAAQLARLKAIGHVWVALVG